MARFLYNILINIFYIPFIFIIFFRKFIGKEDSIKYKEKIFFNKVNRPNGFLFWFHAASIGELNSILPIIDFFLQRDKKFNFLITTVTISSFNEFEKKYKNNDRVFHQFLPYDSNLLINDFFKNWQPNVISFVDSEIWPNFIFKIKKKGLPFILLNARITKKTFDRWKYLKKFATQLFESFSTSITSNKETINYLNFFKANNVKYFGNIKFCSSKNNLEKSNDNDFRNVIKKNIWCAMSIHPGEEEFCGKVQKIVKKKNTNSLLVIIPRHINKNKKIQINLNKMGFNVQIKNETDLINETSEIVLVNYYGSISKYTGIINQIFIGKSLLKRLQNVGGQNPIDAAKSGCQIYHGPYVYNFQEIYDYLDGEGISEKIELPENLAQKLIKGFKPISHEKKKTHDKLNLYSKEIFENVINEYEKYLK